MKGAQPWQVSRRSRDGIALMHFIVAADVERATRRSSRSRTAGSSINVGGGPTEHRFDPAGALLAWRHDF